MSRRDLAARWAADLAALEAEYLLVEAGTSALPVRDVGRIEGMIVAYRRVLEDAA